MDNELILGKYHALKSLLQFVRFFDNWREIWSAYRRSATIPQLRFRNDLVLFHGATDDPIVQFREIFVDRCYVSGGFYNPRPGDTVLDVGANIGFFAHFVASRCAATRIHSFEPGSDARQLLLLNRKTNRLEETITVHPVAISDRCDVIQLHSAKNTAQRSVFANEFVDINQEAEEVKSVTLDEAVNLSGADRIALLKIDTEGAEVEIAEGASQAVWSKIDRVAFEFHDHFRAGSRERVCRVLESNGFRHFRNIASPPDTGFGVVQAGR
jgi:FkbM family methyltransferase